VRIGCVFPARDNAKALESPRLSLSLSHLLRSPERNRLLVKACQLGGPKRKAIGLLARHRSRGSLDPAGQANDTFNCKCHRMGPKQGTDVSSSPCPVSNPPPQFSLPGSAFGPAPPDVDIPRTNSAYTSCGWAVSAGRRQRYLPGRMRGPWCSPHRTSQPQYREPARRGQQMQFCNVVLHNRAGDFSITVHALCRYRRKKKRTSKNPAGRPAHGIGIACSGGCCGGGGGGTKTHALTNSARPRGNGGAAPPAGMPQCAHCPGRRPPSPLPTPGAVRVATHIQQRVVSNGVRTRYRGASPEMGRFFLPLLPVLTP